MAKRSSNIDSDFEQQIIACIKSIKGKLTWDIVIGLVKSQSGERYTEQGLRKRSGIAEAYRLQKKIILREKGVQREAYDIETLSRRLIELEEENNQLKEINNRLINKFATWAHNAKRKGLSEDVLNQPIDIRKS
jgi:hypothetical protein